jgi:uncharacterized repeat protein (TIGR03803 family)
MKEIKTIKFKCLQILLICITLNVYSQPKFWGVTSAINTTGPYGSTMYSTDGNGENYNLLNAFNKYDGLSMNYAKPCLAPNGNIYMVSFSGGTSNAGFIFEFNPTTNVYNKKVEFAGMGFTNPRVGLLLASNGKMYGISEGGINSMGVIFEYDYITNTLTKKIDFAGTTNGRNPRGMLYEADNGKIYGMTFNGGNSNLGVLFEYNPSDNTIVKRYDFNGTNGQYPTNSVTQASNGKLYGLVNAGGTSGGGTLFEFNISTNTFTKRFDFSVTNGTYPHAGLVEFNNKMYGTTSTGGTSSIGTIFEFDPSNNSYTKKIDFNNTNGAFPRGDLSYVGNTKFYGLTSAGGSNAKGVVFEYDLTGNTITKRADFNGTTNGEGPDGSLLLVSNALYGITPNGGSNSIGVFFKFNLQNNTFNKLFDFGSYSGKMATGSLMQASNGKIYGLTKEGGTFNSGTVFEYNTETNTYINIHSFNFTDGYWPMGSLTEIANGKLYGLCSQGGTGGVGTIFEYDINSYTCTHKVSFISSTHGSVPHGSLLKASNGNLYGLTSMGGSSGVNGTLFEYNPNTNVLTKKIDFISNGSKPFGDLIEPVNGKLYGLTSVGGGANLGVLFEYTIATNTLTVKHTFLSSTGAKPFGSLIKGKNGKLYGLTFEGGANNKGVIFEYSIADNTYNKLFDFDGTNSGRNPKGSLSLGKNGKLYGMTQLGGSSDFGVFFEYDISNSTFLKKFDFIGTNGREPVYTKLLQTCTAPTFSNINASACSEYTSPSGKFYNSTGVYLDSVLNSVGCDSIITINLNINKSVSTLNLSQCVNYTSPSGNNTWTQSGTYTDTVTNHLGCDSIITINLTIKNASNATINANSCYSYTFNSQNYSESGTYYQTLTNNAGCDSLITLNLIINQATLHTIDTTNCGSITINSQTFTETGSFIQTLVNSAGCDSLITLNVVINNNSAHLIDTTTCSSFTLNSQTYTESGTYFQTTNNSVGCDSVITINLTVTNINPIVISNGDFYMAFQSGANYQWVDCANNFTPLDGETNQTFYPTPGLYALIVSIGNCADTSECFTVSSLAIQTHSERVILIYSNPAKDLLNIKLNTSAIVEIKSIEGVIIDKFYIKDEEILDISKYSNGVYLIYAITTDGRFIIQKFVKQ